jgi:sec-independent protein translocase protein TatA
MPFGFHPFDLIVVLVIALLIFGPRRLPEIGHTLGKTIRSFQQATTEENEPPQIQSTPAQPEKLVTPEAAETATEGNQREAQTIEHHPSR